MKVLCSASFSVARCSRPICGSAFWITSPSISSTRRSTPWAAGCCGPKFSVKFWISAMAARPRRTRLALLADHLWHSDTRLDADGLVHDAAARGVVAHLDAARQREVLAERMADEAVIRQDPEQVRMAAEQDPVEVKGLALVPVRGSPYLGDRVDHRRLTGRAVTAQPQPGVPRNREEMEHDGEAALGRRRVVARYALDAAAEAGR